MKGMLYIIFHLHFLSFSVAYSISYSIQLHAVYFYTFLSSVDTLIFTLIIITEGHNTVTPVRLEPAAPTCNSAAAEVTKSDMYPYRKGNK